MSPTHLGGASDLISNDGAYVTMAIATQDALARAAQRLQVAYDILDRLQLFERWRPFGNPILVGAVAYELVVAPDIDMEIYCDEPRIEDGFTVLRACALQPGTRQARFANELDGPDLGLYCPKA